MAYFRRQLYETTYRHFLKTRDEIKNMSPDLLEEMGLDSDADEDLANMTEWPEYFEVHEVPKLMKTQLKHRPKLRDFSSMEGLLNEYDIRGQLDRKMEEFHSQ
jgi:hypothetical protein